MSLRTPLEIAADDDYLYNLQNGNINSIRTDLRRAQDELDLLYLDLNEADSHWERVDLSYQINDVRAEIASLRRELEKWDF